jgi:hypothetical protein
VGLHRLQEQALAKMTDPSLSQTVRDFAAGEYNAVDDILYIETARANFQKEIK